MLCSATLQTSIYKKNNKNLKDAWRLNLIFTDNMGRVPKRFRPPSRVSKCHRLTVVQRRKIKLTLRKVLRFLRANWKIHAFSSFSELFVIFYPLYEHI